MVRHPPPPVEPNEYHAPRPVAPPPAQPVIATPEPAAQALTPLPQALSRYAQTLQPLATEPVNTEHALNRCLAEAPAAGIDLPGFTQSAVDGYALLSFETGFAKPANPVELKVIGEITAGPMAQEPRILASRTAYHIMTGGRIPRGVDAVVPQELVRPLGNTIQLEAPVTEKANIRFQGEELKKGESLASTGQRISPGLLAALMAAGTYSIQAYKRPRVSVLVTGDEVTPPGQQPAEGQVYDANGPLIRNWMVAHGYDAPRVAYIKDVQNEIETALHTALDSSDLVITTGGVSVGSRDYLPAAAAACGVRQEFWKVSQKPGKPLYYGLRGKVPLLGMPGNPAAVLIGLVIHARRVLDCLEGVSIPGPRMSAGRLLKAVKADPKRDTLSRMNLSISAEGVVHLDPLPKQASHMLSNLATAMALVMLPARDKGYAANERVLWTPLPGVTRI